MGRRVGCFVAAAVVSMALGGCGSASPPSPPAGVDGLEIPTPDPDPGDFVDGVDNPWLPLEVGATWSYAERGGDRPLVTSVTVATGPDVADVGTTAVTSTVTAPNAVPGKAQASVVSTTVDYYAQDDDGNVWWFGREGEWQAGVDGAEAGLAMAHTPRVGDGYRLAGTEEPQLAEVRDIGEDAEVGGQLYDDVLVVRTTIDGVMADERYVRGTGLVQRVTDDVTGSGTSLELLEHEEPQD